MRPIDAPELLLDDYPEVVEQLLALVVLKTRARTHARTHARTRGSRARAPTRTRASTRAPIRVGAGGRMRVRMRVRWACGGRAVGVYARARTREY